VNAVSNDILIASAQAVLNPHTVDGRRFGDVGSTLVTKAGNHYSGVCIDTSSARLRDLLPDSSWPGSRE